MIVEEEFKNGLKSSQEHKNKSPFFNKLSKGQDYISSKELRTFLINHGYLEDDPRWRNVYEIILQLDQIDEKSFEAIFKHEIWEFNRAIENDLIIPDFPRFCEELREIFMKCKEIISGQPAAYIPQLKKADRNKWGMGLCTIDGQRFDLGDSNEEVTLQSSAKPLIYALALETLGEETVHKYVDKEPSGQTFNSLILTQQDIPHNPLINSGGIALCSIIGQNLDLSQKFDETINFIQKLAGGIKPGFNNSVYMSEKLVGHQNTALAHMMKSKKALPSNTNINEVLEFYYQTCSIELTCKGMAVVAATMANGGVCPLTHERVLSASTTKSVLSLMFSCGMNDYSGQLAFSIGLPCKSGISGLIIVVVPGTCGFCFYSPNVNKYATSERGVEFCKQLVQKFNFHKFDQAFNQNLHKNQKIDPRNMKTLNYSMIVEFLYACHESDLKTIRILLLSGTKVNIMDNDSRTGLHIAASNGDIKVVKFLLKMKANPMIRDKWGNTAIDDARKNDHRHIVELLEKYVKEHNIIHCVD
jgi:glutaminase